MSTEGAPRRPSLTHVKIEYTESTTAVMTGNDLQQHHQDLRGKTPVPPSMAAAAAAAAAPLGKYQQQQQHLGRPDYDEEEEEEIEEEHLHSGGEETEEAAYQRQLHAVAAGGDDDNDDELDNNHNKHTHTQVHARKKSNKGFFDDDTPLPSSSTTTTTTTTTSAPPPANDASFRRRRLTFATQGNIPPHTPLSQIQQRIFRSLEIGDVPKVPLPFREGIVGTYSCHGIEPSYLDTRPFIAKINQDRGVCVYPFAGQEQMALFAVFDGHGEVGDKVSEFCMYELPKTLEAHPALHTDLVRAFKETFLSVDERLARRPDIEAFYSGTTSVVGLIKGKEVWVANAGDSRCTLATVNEAGHLIAQDLSIDQNPDSPLEMERILKAGGFVSPPPEPGLSARVWLDPDFTQVGLAMARSIGDHAVKGVGVIAEPEVLTHTLREGQDKFLLFASDGVWEFISSQEAVTIIYENLHKGVAYACQVLIEHAATQWREIEGEYRDDITAICIRLPLW